MKDSSSQAAESHDELIEVNGYDELPDFASEDEEASFWATHTLSPDFLKTMQRRPLSERLKCQQESTAMRRMQPRSGPEEAPR